MPGDVPPVADEREALLGFLAQQRYLVRLAAYGLDDAQAAATPSPSALSVGGIIKHLTGVERFWMSVTEQRVEKFSSSSADDYTATFRMNSDETLAELLEEYSRSAQETDSAIATFADLGAAVPVPADVPWFPKDVDAWSVRWVLLHLIEETARHAGHGDVVRESIDGATALPLMAAAENWPPSPWMSAWSRQRDGNRLPPLGLLSGGDLVGERYADPKDRPARSVRHHAHVAGVGLGDGRDDGQAEPHPAGGPGPGRVGPVEGLEDVVPVVGGRCPGPGRPRSTRAASPSVRDAARRSGCRRGCG